MVSVLIVGIGVLGVAGMQVMSLQQNRNALLRDQALQAANDILDRMRANEGETYGIAIDSPPTSSFNCLDNTCITSEMASFDIAQWKCRINPNDSNGDPYTVCSGFGITRATLPGGRASIQKIDGVAVVTVEWVNDREGNISRIILRSRTQEV